jgi:hypothetical protein
MFDVTRYTPPLDDLLARLRVIEGAVLVGIDGRMGAGKSALAGWLAQQLGWQRYSLDDSIPKGGGTHQRDVALAAIRQLQQAGTPVLVEGAKLLETISRQEIGLLVFVADNPPCKPSRRHQRAVEDYLETVRPFEFSDTVVINIL